MTKGNRRPHILYRFYDSDDTLLYVGITSDPFARFRSHARDKTWYHCVVRSTMEHFKTRGGLVLAEMKAIQTEKPRYNRAHAVISVPDDIGVKKQSRLTVLADANRFPSPDAVAHIPRRWVGREDQLSELEDHLQSGQVVQSLIPCFECRWSNIYRQLDGDYKCYWCLHTWTPEELVVVVAPLGRCLDRMFG